MDQVSRSWYPRIKFRIALSLSLYLFSCLSLRAEYRAHQYLVTDKSTQKTYTVVSSYNPRAYLAYHGGSQSIELELLNTWVCPGYTGAKKDICLSPMQRLEQKVKP